MEELSGLMAAASSGDASVIKAAVISGVVTVAVLLGNAIVKAAFAGLKSLAKKTKTTLDDEVLADAEKEFIEKSKKK